MKSRLIRIKDTDTDFFCILHQFDPIDEVFCRQIGINTNYKILNCFEGTYVSTFAGNLLDDFFDNKTVTHSTFTGTYKAIGDVLKAVGNEIKYLPDVLNVEKTRLFYISVEGDPLGLNELIQNVNEVITNFDECNIRKRLTSLKNGICIQIFHADGNTQQKILEINYTGHDKESINLEKQRATMIFLWLPYEKI